MMDASQQLFDDLRTIKRLSFTASTNHESGWNGVGAGDVLVETPFPDQIIFRETGRWRSPQGREFQFRNVYRWSRNGPDLVRLEHLRMGEGRPVLLFDLRPDGQGGWASVEGHQCKADCYTAELRVGGKGIRLEWTIAGPGRRDVIAYEYCGE